ncbi:hypothetical protein G7Y89_g13887 [Cudoniella acicularis]|uniref:Uncharacterized protein n=1 Tax=Cudoniella acicularis TaxID=354080 RepID=A0A8H4VY87_9HELO|nr:hypothetical protein G7Y89_g13887 [Cudoniella acicularis]
MRHSFILAFLGVAAVTAVPMGHGGVATLARRDWTVDKAANLNKLHYDEADVLKKIFCLGDSDKKKRNEDGHKDEDGKGDKDNRDNKGNKDDKDEHGDEDCDNDDEGDDDGKDGKEDKDDKDGNFDGFSFSGNWGKKKRNLLDWTDASNNDKINKIYCGSNNDKKDDIKELYEFFEKISQKIREKLDMAEELKRKFQGFIDEGGDNGFPDFFGGDKKVDHNKKDPFDFFGDKDGQKDDDKKGSFWKKVDKLTEIFSDKKGDDIKDLSSIFGDRDGKKDDKKNPLDWFGDKDGKKDGKKNDKKNPLGFFGGKDGKDGKKDGGRKDDKKGNPLDDLFGDKKDGKKDDKKGDPLGDLFGDKKDSPKKTAGSVSAASSTGGLATAPLHQISNQFWEEERRAGGVEKRVKKGVVMK